MIKKERNLWVARDESGQLNIFEKKPKKLLALGEFFISNLNDNSRFFSIDRDLYPEVTWDNSPKELKSLIQ